MVNVVKLNFGPRIHVSSARLLGHVQRKSAEELNTAVDKTRVNVHVT